MHSSNLSLLEVERAIKKFPPEKQRKLLIELPRLLDFKFEDLELLKLAEISRASLLFFKASSGIIFAK